MDESLKNALDRAKKAPIQQNQNSFEGKTQSQIVEILQYAAGNLFAESHSKEYVNSILVQASAWIVGDENLKKASPKNIIVCLSTCISLGISLIKGQNQGRLEARYNKSGALVVSLQKDYMAWLTIALRNPNVLSVEVRSVLNTDQFEYEYGTSPYLKHKPNPNSPITDEKEENVRACYALLRLKNGGIYFSVLEKKRLIYLRGLNTTSNKKAWDHFGAMGKVKAIKDVAKYIPDDPMVAYRAVHDDDNDEDTPTSFDNYFNDVANATNTAQENKEATNATNTDQENKGEANSDQIPKKPDALPKNISAAIKKIESGEESIDSLIAKMQEHFNLSNDQLDQIKNAKPNIIDRPSDNAGQSIGDSRVMATEEDIIKLKGKIAVMPFKKESLIEEFIRVFELSKVEEDDLKSFNPDDLKKGAKRYT